MNIIAWILIAIIAGFGLAILLYYKEKNNYFSKKTKILLIALRTTTVAIIVLLLANIFFKIKTTEVEKPIIVFLQDNSKSIIANADSVYFRTQYLDKITNLKNDLRKHANVVSYAFDEKLNLTEEYDFDGVQTNLFNALEELDLRYENRNLVSVIIASDGIVNSGSTDFDQNIKNLNVPIHTLALGDTTVVPDLKISEIKFNKSTAYGNKFPVEIIYQAVNLKDKTTNLRLKQNNKEIKSKKFEINTDYVVEKEIFILEANEKGIIKIELTLDNLFNEKNISNNHKIIYINVIEQKHKVAFLYHSPHPDISAVKSALDAALNIETSLYQVEQTNTYMQNNYDLFVVHQLPSQNFKNQNFYEFLKRTEIPIFYMHGLNSDLNQFNSLNTNTKFNVKTNHTNEYFTHFNSNFSYFSLSEHTLNEIINFPPLSFYQGNLNVGANSQTLFFQRIGNVNTQFPFLIIENLENKTNANLLGEGIFKWRTHNFARNKSHEAFNEIFQKIANLLLQSVDNRQLRLFFNDKHTSNENVYITAELYNKLLEKTNKPDVNLTILNESNQKFDLQFTRGLNNYFANLGKLNPGKYRISATANLDGSVIVENGIFIVEELDVEKMNIVANHNLLKNISASSNGIFANNNSLENIFEFIKNDKSISEIEHYTVKFSEIINLRFLLILLIILLSIEWFVRKYLGSI